MKIGSLFSGIGGLELGLERSGLGHTIWQVEQDEYCRSTLARHWPNAKRYNDVRDIKGKKLPYADVICGGFPCQDVSSAGTRQGLTGSRSGLWREYARIVRECTPTWVVVENVASGANLWFDTVVCDLEKLNYDTLPIPVQADWLGAPYTRARIFVLARRREPSYAYGDRQPIFTVNAEASGASEVGQIPGHEGEGVSARHPWCPPQPEVADMVPRVPGRVAGQRALGNCVVPLCAEVVGWIVRELCGL